MGVVGVVGVSVAFYWLISTYELERQSDWLISSCGAGGSRGGRLLKFLGEADESTEISLAQYLIFNKMFNISWLFNININTPSY